MEELDTSSDRLVIDMECGITTKTAAILADSNFNICDVTNTTNCVKQETDGCLSPSAGEQDADDVAPPSPHRNKDHQHHPLPLSNRRHSAVKRSISAEESAQNMKMRIKRKKNRRNNNHLTSPTSESAASSTVFFTGGEQQQLADICETNEEQQQQCCSKSLHRDASTWVRTVSTSTDPDCLGPCEPGTHVTLEGVVWNETANGLLVVNVTWRGKSYVGTLLDCTKHDWAPPRLCDSPENDSSRTPAKGGRNGKRSSKLSHSQTVTDLSSIRNNGSSKSGKKAKTLSSSSNSNTLTINVVSDEDGNSQPGPPWVGDLALQEPMSPILQECPCPQCDHRYMESVALKFHQNAVHLPTDDSKIDTKMSVVPQQNDDCAAVECNVMTDDPMDAKVGDSLLTTTSTSSSSAGSTPPSSTTVIGHLTEEESQRSLQQLFAGVVSEQTTSPQPISTELTNAAAPLVDPPQLEPPLDDKSREESTRSPAYSDISDDGAPVLEKESEENCDRPKTTRNKSSPQKLASAVKVASPSVSEIIPCSISCDAISTGCDSLPMPIGNHIFPSMDASVIAPIDTTTTPISTTTIIDQGFQNGNSILIPKQFLLHPPISSTGGFLPSSGVTGSTMGILQPPPPPQTTFAVPQGLTAHQMFGISDGSSGGMPAFPPGIVLPRGGLAVSSTSSILSAPIVATHSSCSPVGVSPAAAAQLIAHAHKIHELARPPVTAPSLLSAGINGSMNDATKHPSMSSAPPPPPMLAESQQLNLRMQPSSVSNQPPFQFALGVRPPSVVPFAGGAFLPSPQTSTSTLPMIPK